LFPNISTAMSNDMDELARKTFGSLHDKADAVLDLIGNDVDMALASRPRRVESQGDGVEKRLREELLGEVKELKKRHEELLDGIANLF
jgi:hypothetical protein